MSNLKIECVICRKRKMLSKFTGTLLVCDKCLKMSTKRLEKVWKRNEGRAK